ncbi:Uncharacterized protein conserved in bacteria [Klebsiella pneumoniae]|nr:Uncharacterized protein conserved in bacteria [Klebsiella pneumoniae]
MSLFFFMISGFVIPYSFKKEPRCYSIFITTRFFRLYPAYWFSLILAVLVYYSLNIPLPTIKQFLANITMFQMGIGQQNIIGVYWTLFIELIFYIICIILAKKRYLWDEKKMVVMFYFFIFLSLLSSIIRFALHKKIPVAIPLGLSMMFLGYAWRACVIDNNNYIMLKIKWMIAVCMVSTFACGYLSYSWDHQTDEPWENFSYAYVLGMLVFIIMTKYIKINTRLTCYLGMISYSLYLVHDPIISFFSSFKIGGILNLQYELKITAIISAILFSCCVYSLIGKPSIALGRRIVKKIRKSNV